MALQGMKILNVRERPMLDASGQPRNEVVISIQTDLGGTGDLIVPQNQYAKLSDEDLEKLIAEKAMQLDKPFLLSM